jgi:hypothetical protein
MGPLQCVMKLFLRHVGSVMALDDRSIDMFAYVMALWHSVRYKWWTWHRRCNSLREIYTKKVFSSHLIPC